MEPGWSNSHRRWATADSDHHVAGKDTAFGGVTHCLYTSPHPALRLSVHLPPLHNSGFHVPSSAPSQTVQLCQSITTKATLRDCIHSVVFIDAKQCILLRPTRGRVGQGGPPKVEWARVGHHSKRRRCPRDRGAKDLIHPGEIVFKLSGGTYEIHALVGVIPGMYMCNARRA
jgi:hypothetical protein